MKSGRCRGIHLSLSSCHLFHYVIHLCFGFPTEPGALLPLGDICLANSLFGVNFFIIRINQETSTIFAIKYTLHSTRGLAMNGTCHLQDVIVLNKENTQ